MISLVVAFALMATAATGPFWAVVVMTVIFSACIAMDIYTIWSLFNEE